MHTGQVNRAGQPSARGSRGRSGLQHSRTWAPLSTVAARWKAGTWHAGRACSRGAGLRKDQAPKDGTKKGPAQKQQRPGENECSRAACAACKEDKRSDACRADAAGRQRVTQKKVHHRSVCQLPDRPAGLHGLGRHSPTARSARGRRSPGVAARPPAGRLGSSCLPAGIKSPAGWDRAAGQPGSRSRPAGHSSVVGGVGAQGREDLLEVNLPARKNGGGRAGRRAGRGGGARHWWRQAPGAAPLPAAPRRDPTQNIDVCSSGAGRSRRPCCCGCGCTRAAQRADRRQGKEGRQEGGVDKGMVRKKERARAPVLSTLGGAHHAFHARRRKHLPQLVLWSLGFCRAQVR